jgi:hypothetical protein
MNMKIALTQIEFKEIVLKHFNLESIGAGDVEIIVENYPNNFSCNDDFNQQAEHLIDIMNNRGFIDINGDIYASEWIEAIKLFKNEIDGCTLVNARDAIHNWKKFILAVRMKGLPGMTFKHGNVVENFIKGCL